MIGELRGEYPVRLLCRVLEVSRSGFHAWLVRQPSARARFCERLKVAAQAAHQRTRQTYGAERLRHELAADGFPVSLGTVKRVRRELGLRCVQRQRRFRVQTTDSGHSLPVAPNLLGQEFKVERPDEVWTADITYVATDEGWLYVAAIKDLFAGEVVGRSFGRRMTTELVVRAFEQAVSARRPEAGLTHHSDRGSQYCSREYQALLASYEMRCSMSRKGNCYDNAPVESFSGTLKTELVHRRRYAGRAPRPRARSGSTSTSFTTGSGGRLGSGTCRPRLTRNCSRGNNEQRERHTWRPFLTTHLRARGLHGRVPA
jgi:putative transposase